MTDFWLLQRLDHLAMKPMSTLLPHSFWCAVSSPDSGDTLKVLRRLAAVAGSFHRACCVRTTAPDGGLAGFPYEAADHANFHLDTVVA